MAQGHPDCVPKIVVSFHLSCALSHAMHGTHSASSSFSFVQGVLWLRTSRNPCADSRERQGDGCSDPEPLTGYEPNRIVDNQIITEQDNITYTEDNQINEIEGHVKTLSFNQSLLSSTQDSIEGEKQVRNDRKFVILKEKA